MNEHITTVCLIGQGAACCRYLMMGRDGFECAKLTPGKRFLDQRVADGLMGSVGDNCDGRTDLS